MAFLLTRIVYAPHPYFSGADSPPELVRGAGGREGFIERPSRGGQVPYPYYTRGTSSESSFSEVHGFFHGSNDFLHYSMRALTLHYLLVIC